MNKLINILLLSQSGRLIEVSMTEVISTMQKTGRWLSGKEAKDQGEEDIVLNKAIQGRPP